MQCTAKPNMVESLFTTAQHALDRTRKVTILAKHKVTETERSACWKEHDRAKTRQETTLFPVLFYYEYFKTLLLYFKKYLGFKYLRLLRKMRK